VIRGSKGGTSGVHFRMLSSRSMLSGFFLLNPTRRTA
jgi:hypothetical protein